MTLFCYKPSCFSYVNDHVHRLVSQRIPQFAHEKQEWFVRLRANGRNNSQQCWDLQCIVGRIQPISLCTPCIISVRGPNNVGRAVQTDPTLLCYASAIAEQKKCWELLAEKFNRFQTLRNNTQQHATTCNRVCKRTQYVTSNNVGSCWPTMLHPFARDLTKQGHDQPCFYSKARALSTQL